MASMINAALIGVLGGYLGIDGGLRLGLMLMGLGLAIYWNFKALNYSNEGVDQYFEPLNRFYEALKQNDFEAAREILESARENLNDDDYYTDMLETLFLAGDLSAAEKLAPQAIKAAKEGEAESAEWEWLLLAQIKLHQGDFRAGRQAIANSADPAEQQFYKTDYHLLFAEMALREGQAESALAELEAIPPIPEKSLEWEFDDAIMLALAGAWAHFKQGEVALAGALLQKYDLQAEGKAPKEQTKWHYYAGLAALASPQPERARAYFEQAVVLGKGGLYSQLARREIDKLGT
jgi:hypothetical protein